MSRHKGEVLCLNGLTTLSDNAARWLGGHNGWLELDGVTTLSDVAAGALSVHKGYLSLDGLTTLSDVAADILRSNRDISFRGR